MIATGLASLFLAKLRVINYQKITSYLEKQKQAMFFSLLRSLLFGVLIVSSAGLASLFLTKLRVIKYQKITLHLEKQKQTMFFGLLRSLLFGVLIVSSAGLASLFLTKLRFENSSNKKTLKQAWRFFLSNYLFVTSTGFKPVTF